VCCAASSNRKETGELIMFGTEPWGYGGYKFHMVIWIMLAIAVVAGVVWHLRSGSSWCALSHRASRSARRFISVLEECPEQPPQFAVPSRLAALLEIIRDIHCGGLHLNRAVNACVQMRNLALDIQAFGVRIEDQRATIRVGDLWASYLAVQLAS
jgi:hypothetical protein